MIYDQEVKAHKMVDDDHNVQESFNRKEIDETKLYPQRELEPTDGLLFFYGENQGKMQMSDDYAVEKIQILICITMYNEDRASLKGTLLGIQRNLAEFKKIGISSDQIVAVILQDGILKMHKVFTYFRDSGDSSFI